MIANGFLGLSPEEIVGMLAIFIEEIKSEDKLNFSDLKVTPNTNLSLDKSYREICITPKLREYINDIITMIDHFIYIEQEVGILDNEIYWNISFDFVDVALYWVRGEPLKVFEGLKNNIYIGNFIRNMMKINNIVKDLIHLFQIDGDNEVIPVLKNRTINNERFCKKIIVYT